MATSSKTDLIALTRDRVALSEQLRAGRETMLDPQDLPGRYGRVIEALDRVLKASDLEAVLAGGWAVWRHGFFTRLTADVDIVVAVDQIEELLRVAPVTGFDVLPEQPGRWRKLVHRETGVRVDIIPEGGRPGTRDRPAPTTIGHPARMGAVRGVLRYATIESLVELKLAAGRAKDDLDVIELIGAATEETVAAIRRHLETVHPDYVTAFERLIERARTELEER